jgi:hypothetical protein
VACTIFAWSQKSRLICSLLNPQSFAPLYLSCTIVIFRFFGKGNHYKGVCGVKACNPTLGDWGSRIMSLRPVLAIWVDPVKNNKQSNKQTNTSFFPLMELWGRAQPKRNKSLWIQRETVLETEHIRDDYGGIFYTTARISTNTEELEGELRSHFCFCMCVVSFSVPFLSFLPQAVSSIPLHWHPYTLPSQPFHYQEGKHLLGWLYPKTITPWSSAYRWSTPARPFREGLQSQTNIAMEYSL